MEIAVVGVGGVGGYYGGKLARFCADRAEANVTFIARGEHLAEIRRKGLDLITDEGDFTAVPTRATDSPAGCGVFDLVLLCVKAYDLGSAARSLSGNTNEQTAVLTVLNGVDNADRLRTALPHARILNGCVYLSAYIVRPGVVQQAGGSCKLFFGQSGAGGGYEPIERLLLDAGIKAEYREDIQRVVWEKFLFISPLANATTYLGKTFGQIMENSQARDLLSGLIQEAEKVARAEGVDLARDICETTFAKVSTFPAGTKTSMQKDFENGRRLELETFTGYIVESGKSRGVDSPLYNRIYHALKELSNQTAVMKNLA
jgi:2-dehydropantoate 2-reductase